MGPTWKQPGSSELQQWRQPWTGDPHLGRAGDAAGVGVGDAERLQLQRRTGLGSQERRCHKEGRST